MDLLAVPPKASSKQSFLLFDKPLSDDIPCVPGGAAVRLLSDIIVPLNTI